MRNSVKVVIDAYDGTVRAYVAVPSDPLIRTWQRIFPGIFKPLDSMPADLRAHLRYPDQIYRIQAALYTTYHMDSPVRLLPPRGPVADPEPVGSFRRRALHAAHHHEAAG